MSENHERTNSNSPGIRISLNRKTFIITLLLTFGIGVTVLVAGFFLYLTGVLSEYYVNTWNQANAEASVIDQTDYRELCDEIISLYDSIPDAEKGDGTSEEYKSRFAGFLDERYTGIQEAMRSFQNRNGPINAFVVALDENTDRMIYLIDADPNPESTCIPGTWDNYPHEQIEILINGNTLRELDKENGLTKGNQAVLTDRHPYGLRCTAGSTLYETDKYTVLVCVDEPLNNLIRRSLVFLIQYVVLLVVVVLIASFIGMGLMRRATVIPINRMAEAAVRYGGKKEKDNGKRCFDDLNINTGDELEDLAMALKGMEEDIEAYVDNLTTVTAERERIETELSLASRIQKSMLIEDFPVFPDRHEFDIFASMEPAKEVGGDFYDMIMIDDDHVALEIADVSGKGIPASLFMMASKILIGGHLRQGMSPAEVLETVNNSICAGSHEGMFVTVWIGILEISTGKVTAANAGHEYPVLVRSDGSAEVIHDKHGFVVGGMEGMKYKEYELQLDKGDKLFVYTDGVTEATSADQELFGMDRMTEAAGSAGSGAHPADIMKSVRDAITEFTSGAEQFDDLTMLCVEYRGTDSLESGENE